MSEELLTEAKAHFSNSDYTKSKAVFQSISTLPSVASDILEEVDQWIRKCDVHLVSDQKRRDAAQTSTTTSAAAVSVSAPSSCVASPSVRFEWFQTLSHVTITFYVKNRTSEDVKVVVEPRAVTVTIMLENKTEYQFSTTNALFAEVDQVPSSVNIRPPKVEVVLLKKVPFQWGALETKTTDKPLPSTSTAAPVVPSDDKGLPYPTSKGTDWNKVKLSEEDSKEGGDELNNFFKKIYSDGTDEQRKAMIKSFTESNGTTLSTNWGDVGARHVKGEAPKGMEEKKWTE